jgi:DNA-binding PadR family transcriptional regulator
LAVLELLHERPMHPYEVRQHVMERGLDQVIKLNPGSLYATVERLARDGLIESVETSREGRRPERTIYRITAKGLEEFFAGLREILMRPAKERPVFAAALAFIASLPPDEAVRLLECRALQLEADIAGVETLMPGVERAGVPRIFTVESEYLQALRKAELEMIKGLVADIKAGTLRWPEELLRFQEQGGALRLHGTDGKEQVSGASRTTAG